MNPFRNRKHIENKIKQKFADFEVKPDASLWERFEKNIPEGDFENKVKSLLDEVEVHPSTEIWPNIETELNDERGMRTWWRYATLVMLIFVLFAALFYTNTQIKVANEKIVQDAFPDIESIDRSTKPSGNQVKESPSQKQRIKNTNQINTADYSTQKSELETIVNKTSNNKSQPTVYNKQKIYKSSLAVNSNHTDNNNLVPNNNIEDIGKNSSQEIFAVDISNKDSILKNENPFLSSIKSDKGTDKFDSLPLIDSLPNTGRTLAANATSSNLSEPGKVDEESGLTRFSISMVAGVNYCMMRLESPEVGRYPLEENTALRRAIEQPEVDWAFQFLLNYDLNKKWMLSAGFGRLLFKQSFYYNITLPESAHSPNESPGQMQNPGDSIVSGNSYISNIRYSWTEIPIMLTYRFPTKQKFSFQLSSGISYAFLSNLDVAMVNYDNVGILMLTDKESFPGFRNEFFTTIAMGLNYSVNQSVELSLIPQCKIGLRNMIENPDWVKQYPYFVGLHFGLRKKF